MGALCHRSVGLGCLSFALCLAVFGLPLRAQVLELPPPRAVQGLGPIPFEEWTDPSMAGHTLFGSSVAVFGDTALVGIPGFRNDTGRVGIFKRDASGVWRRTGSIESPTGAVGSTFGSRVRLTQHFAFVSFFRDSAFRTYIYGRTGNGFRFLRSTPRSFEVDEATGHLLTTLREADGSVVVKLGRLDSQGILQGLERFVIPADLNADVMRRAAIWDGTYVLTNPSDNGSQGAAHVFERRDGRWRQIQKLIAADGNAADLFGSSVAVQGETIVIGATGADAMPNPCDFSGDGSGSVYVFKRRNGLWSEDQKLKSVGEDPRCSTRFGDRIFFSGEVLLVQDDRSDSVAVVRGWHVFRKQFGQYQPVAYQLQTIERAGVIAYEMQGATLFQGFPTDGCCDETGGVAIWDLTP